MSGSAKRKFKVSRFHYNDLLCLSENDRSGESKKIFDSFEFDIIENPAPNEWTTDLSVCFMYPHRFKFPIAG